MGGLGHRSRNGIRVLWCLHVGSQGKEKRQVSESSFLARDHRGNLTWLGACQQRMASPDYWLSRSETKYKVTQNLTFANLCLDSWKVFETMDAWSSHWLAIHNQVWESSCLKFAHCDKFFNLYATISELTSDDLGEHPDLLHKVPVSEAAFHPLVNTNSYHCNRTVGYPSSKIVDLRLPPKTQYGMRKTDATNWSLDSQVAEKAKSTSDRQMQPQSTAQAAAIQQQVAQRLSLFRALRDFPFCGKSLVPQPPRTEIVSIKELFELSKKPDVSSSSHKPFPFLSTITFLFHAASPKFGCDHSFKHHVLYSVLLWSRTFLLFFPDAQEYQGVTSPIQRPSSESLRQTEARGMIMVRRYQTPQTSGHAILSYFFGTWSAKVSTNGSIFLTPNNLSTQNARKHLRASVDRIALPEWSDISRGARSTNYVVKLLWEAYVKSGAEGARKIPLSSIENIRGFTSQ